MNTNAPLKGVNLTRSPALWVKHLHISALQKQKDQLRFEVRKEQTEEI